MARRMKVQVFGNDIEAASLVIPSGSQLELQVDSEQLIGFPLGFTFSVLISNADEAPRAQDSDVTKQLAVPEPSTEDSSNAKAETVKAKLTRAAR